jgi:hypothetical protein
VAASRVLARIAVLSILATVARCQRPVRVIAIVVEAQATPRCSGLDCPPWHVPDDVDLCFEAGGKIYTGTYRPWGMPWDTKGERLLAMKGKQVRIAFTDKEIVVASAGSDLKLKRVHHNVRFSSVSCSNG